MSGRLLNRWGKIKKPQLLARIERLEQHGQTVIPGLQLTAVQRNNPSQ